MANSSQMRGFFILMLGLFLIAAWIQTHIVLNWDVSFLMHASAKLLGGGTYTQHFFETNPPMILFLYIPSILLAKGLSINYVLSMNLYIFTIAASMLWICWILGKKIFLTEQNNTLLFILIFSLGIVFLFLPVFHFGQREHLALMLVSPYLLTCALRLSRYPLSRSFTFLIGILAGFGFAIKPYFLIPLALCEITFILYQRRFFSWLRPEFFAISFVMLSYLCCVYWFTPDYPKIVVPLLLHLYYPGFKTPLSTLVFSDRFLYCLIPLLFFIFTWKKFSYLPLRLIIFVAASGFCLSYFIENTLWYYHLLPFLSLAIVLSCLLCGLAFPVTVRLSLQNLAHLAFWLVFLWFPIALIVEFTKDIFPDKLYGKRHHLLVQLKTLPTYKSCYIISSNGYDFPIIVDYANKKYVSRFANYWWLPGIINLSKSTISTEEKIKLQHEKNYFIQAIIDDIQFGKPDLIFVDTRKHNDELNAPNINYIEYLSENNKFKKLWQRYHLLTKTINFDIYTDRIL